MFQDKTDNKPKNPTTAYLLTLFLGGIGAHRFYLGQKKIGMLYFLFSWTCIPGIIAFIELFSIKDRVNRSNKSISAQQIYLKLTNKDFFIKDELRNNPIPSIVINTVEPKASLNMGHFQANREGFFIREWHSISRQQKALIQDFKIETINDQIYKIKSKENIYEVSSSQCSCPDFKENKQTCKHMYFVANDLKIFNLSWGLLWNDENQKIIDFLTTNEPLKYNSFQKKDKIEDYIKNNIIRDDVKNQIYQKPFNLKKDLLFNSFPDLEEKFAKINIDISKNTPKKELLDLVNLHFPELVQDLKENYYILGNENIYTDTINAYYKRQGFINNQTHR